jgi:hypothetical protein
MAEYTKHSYPTVEAACLALPVIQRKRSLGGQGEPNCPCSLCKAWRLTSTRHRGLVRRIGRAASLA